MGSTDRPRVSVAMCTYNGIAFAEEQVRSILAQTRPPDELVVADDGSTDGTLELVRSIVVEHRRENPDAATDYVELSGGTEPLGLVGNFSRALAATTGDYVALSDQDDVWVPERLAVLTRVLDERSDVALVHSDAELVDANGAPLGVTLFEALGVSRGELSAIHHGRAFDALLRRNLVTGATAVFRREVLDAAMPVPDGWIHDEWIAMIAATLWRTEVVERPLVAYRQHGANEIGASKLTMRRRISKLREPRTERNRNLFRRAQELVTRLEAMSDRVARKRLLLATYKMGHERRRTALPPARWRRVPSVLGGWITRRYSRYGLGPQDVLRDLVQPAD